MFSSALKSFSSNITSNYTLSSTPSTYSGPWKIYDAKKKSTGRAVSVFTFDKKTLEPQSGLPRSNVGSLKRAHEEVVERLKKEASSLARLRHPNILELVEPVEGTRNGGLMFATEPVIASLAGLLAEKDAQEKAGGAGSRARRYMVEDSEAGEQHQKEVELDDLEIQKGLLQVAKGLEFLHESAGLVHSNLTPDAIYINAKSDWKISGLGYSGPPDQSTTNATVAPVAIWEALNYDSRLPRFVQLNLDYSSPDFVLDSNVNPSADLFSLGLLIIALFNSPHASPLHTNGSVSAYKRLFNSAASIPSTSNDFMSSKPLPAILASSVLPRLVTRRPAERLTAREFQQSQYFDNILVSTIRFLETLPAKTPKEKSDFIRGLSRILPQFPKSALEKKLLPALLEEMKDRELLALILQDVFQIITLLPSGRRAFTEKVIPKLREVYLTGPGSTSLKGQAHERDLGKEGGLMIIVQNISTVAENCSGKDFKDDILPIFIMAVESPTHPLVDASLKSLSLILPVLDYSTTNTELFPVIAGVFSKTSSLGIKIRGLEAFEVLCGGKSGSQDSSTDGLDGITPEDRNKSSKASSKFVLDKYTIQEKMVPLIKAIKTKEPAVMMAALNVFTHIGTIVDVDFVAMEVIPSLWSMALGPLLNLQQFRTFMDLIKSLSARVEREQIKKLQELSENTSELPNSSRGKSFLPLRANQNSNLANGTGPSSVDDFEKLVSGSKGGGTSTNGTTSGGLSPGVQIGNNRPTFSWSTSASTGQDSVSLPLGNTPTSRTITPDLSGFAALTPSVGTNESSHPSSFNQQQTPSAHNKPPPYNWSSVSSSNAWSSASMPASQSGSQPNSQTTQGFSSYAIPPPPSLSQTSSFSTTPSTSFSIPPPQSSFSSLQPNQPAFGGHASINKQTYATPQPAAGPAQPQRTGLDKYESLL